jgi:uncharacterized protein YecT (DUF1311 family)
MGHLAASLLLFFAVAQADRCDSPQTQTEMNVCSAEEFHRTDVQLNAAYKHLMKTLEPERRRKLQAAQRAWLAFRDAHCAFEASDSEGGTIHPLEVSTCLTALTTERIGQLKE